MDDFDENDNLWKALGQAKPAKASPYFVRKVLREVRNQRQAPSLWQVWKLRLRWLAPVGAAAGLAVGIATWEAHQRHESEFNAFFDSAADLESLVAFEETSAWADLN